MAHSTINKKINSFEADAKVNEDDEARYAILALNRDRVEKRKVKKEQFRVLLGILSK